MGEELKVQVDKRQVRHAFERAAAGYDAAAVLQREVARRMAERLDYVKLAPATILDAGCGTGTGSELLRRHYPRAELIGLDLALAMLQRSRARLPWWKRRLPIPGAAPQGFVCADVERLPFKPSCVDLLWSNLTLQWCNDLEHTFAECYRVLAPGGLLMFSTFGPDTLKELRQAFAGIDGHTHVNRFIDMHDIGDMLVYAGFATPVMDMEIITLTYPDLLSLLRELKAIGAHNATLARGRGLMGRARWQTMTANYEKFRRDGRLPATFEVVYGHAWVGERKKPRLADGRQIIELRIQSRKAGLR